MGHQPLPRCEHIAKGKVKAMFTMNYNEIAKVRRADLLREVEKERLIKIAQAGQPTLIDSIQIKIGEVLTKIGGCLQNQTQPISNPDQSVLEN